MAVFSLVIDMAVDFLSYIVFAVTSVLVLVLMIESDRCWMVIRNIVARVLPLMKNHDMQMINEFRKESQIRNEREEERIIYTSDPLSQEACFPLGKITENGRIRYVMTNENIGSPHINIMGGTGSGKTSGCLIPAILLMKQIVGYAIDVSGDIIKNSVHSNVMVYDLVRKNLKWNIFGPIDEAESEDEKIELLEDNVLTIFPNIEIEKQTQGASKFYGGLAQDIYHSALISYYFDGLDFCEIIEKIITSGYVDLFTEIENSGNQYAYSWIAKYKGSNETNLASGYGDCCRALQQFITKTKINDKLIGRGEDSFDISIVNEKFLILYVPQVKMDDYCKLLTLFTSQLMRVIGHREIGQMPRQYIMLDEFETLLANSSNLINLVNTGLKTYRKLNTRIILLTQTIPGLKSIIGEDNVESIVSNSGVNIVIGAFDHASRKYWSDLIGTMPIQQKDGTYKREPLVYESSFQNIRNKTAYIIWQGGYRLVSLTPYYEDPILQTILAHRTLPKELDEYITKL